MLLVLLTTGGRVPSVGSTLTIGFPGMDDFNFAQEITISHDGRPFLAYESRSWIFHKIHEPFSDWRDESLRRGSPL